MPERHSNNNSNKNLTMNSPMIENSSRLHRHSLSDGSDGSIGTDADHHERSTAQQRDVINDHLANSKQNSVEPCSLSYDDEEIRRSRKRRDTSNILISTSLPIQVEPPVPSVESAGNFIFRGVNEYTAVEATPRHRLSLDQYNQVGKVSLSPYFSAPSPNCIVPSPSTRDKIFDLNRG
jgi:hypothetical protein